MDKVCRTMLMVIITRENSLMVYLKVVENIIGLMVVFSKEISSRV